MMKIGEKEVTEHYVEFGIENRNGDVLFCDSRKQAEWDAMLYPDATVVRREIFVTQWVTADD